MNIPDKIALLERNLESLKQIGYPEGNTNAEVMFRMKYVAIEETILKLKQQELDHEKELVDFLIQESFEKIKENKADKYKYVFAPR